MCSQNKRYLFKIYGIVQGVGFRPFVYKKAREFNIYGWVNNSGASVLIDCSGTKDNIRQFILAVIKEPPGLARIEKVECSIVDYMDYDDFVIRDSVESNEKTRFISPDVSVCPKCIEDIMKENTMRYRYAFTNCTDCGPRYTIIKSLPYDRKSTTMSSFQMCTSCSCEYEDPDNRRFHAQPNCCSKCGPSLYLIDNNKEIIVCSDPVDKTIELMGQGSIAAIKGLGGFHIACDAKNESTIRELRNRKNRPDKPLAVMAKDIDTVKKYCKVSEIEERALKSNKSPIVLLEKKLPLLLPGNIAPRQKRLGVMLPYTPLHYLLFEKRLDIIVMTSGNSSGTPIQYKNEEAFEKIHKIADCFLMHNREIHVPVDDPVIKVIHDEESVIRTARGYAPYSMNVGIENEIAALGPEQKNTFSISKNGYAYMSQYLGDLKDLDSYNNYRYVFKHLCSLFNINPKIYVHDLHPAFLTTEYANLQEGRKIAVQHHHAHMVSCMAEHSLHSQVIGIIYDGTGLGTDGTIWGGEFFVGTRSTFKRLGHLREVSIQGGDKAVQEPWRCAASYIYSLGYELNLFFNGTVVESLDILKQALDNDLNCFKSSSMGRLFDCIAALTGIRNYITYEGQAAIELENIMEDETEEYYGYLINEVNGVFIIEYNSIIEGVLKDLFDGLSKSLISVKFHNTISNATCSLVVKIRNIYSINDVVLSGGVFENQYLLKSVYKGLMDMGFNVFYNRKVPINDSGISLGQLAVADKIIMEEEI